MPPAANPLAELRPFDPGALERGLERFLRNLDEVAQVIGVPPAARLSPWLLAAAAAGGVLAWRIMPRRAKRGEPNGPARADASESSSWTTD